MQNNGASFIDANNTYWYGSWGLGLFRVDLASGSVKNYGRETGLGNDLIVNSMAQGFGDTLWTANFKDGILSVEMPHKKEPSSKKIQIK